MNNDDLVSGDKEFRRAAERLVMVRKVGAAAYVEIQIKEMQDIGDEENQSYWESILKEVEKLLYEA